jgi:hypothetical protein
LAWRRALSTVFTLPDASTDGGWDIDREARVGLFIGSVGVEPHIIDGHATVDLSKAMTSGFSVASGRVAWRSPGTYVCELLPCAGEYLAGYSSPSSGFSSPSVGVRLLETGTASGSVGGTPTFSPNATAELQGFDPASAKPVWSFKLGHHVKAASEGALPRTGRATNVLHMVRERSRWIFLPAPPSDSRRTPRPGASE